MTPGTAGTARGELTITRVFDAPRERVFKAFVEPEQFVRFWGPVGMTVPLSSVKIDPRPGGIFECVMVSDADGSEYPMSGTYLEVVEPERIVFTEPEIGMISTMTFTDLGGKTELVVHQTNVPEAYRGPDAVAGFNSSFDRLAEHLAQG